MVHHNHIIESRSGKNFKDRRKGKDYNEVYENYIAEIRIEYYEFVCT